MTDLASQKPAKSISNGNYQSSDISSISSENVIVINNLNTM